MCFKTFIFHLSRRETLKISWFTTNIRLRIFTFTIGLKPIPNYLFKKTNIWKFRILESIPSPTLFMRNSTWAWTHSFPMALWSWTSLETHAKPSWNERVKQWSLQSSILSDGTWWRCWRRVRNAGCRNSLGMPTKRGMFLTFALHIPVQNRLADILSTSVSQTRLWFYTWISLYRLGHRTKFMCHCVHKIPYASTGFCSPGVVWGNDHISMFQEHLHHHLCVWKLSTTSSLGASTLEIRQPLRRS